MSSRSTRELHVTPVLGAMSTAPRRASCRCGEDGQGCECPGCGGGARHLVAGNIVGHPTDVNDIKVGIPGDGALRAGEVVWSESDWGAKESGRSGRLGEVTSVGVAANPSVLVEYGYGNDGGNANVPRSSLHKLQVGDPVVEDDRGYEGVVVSLRPEWRWSHAGETRRVEIRVSPGLKVIVPIFDLHRK